MMAGDENPELHIHPKQEVSQIEAVKPAQESIKKVEAKESKQAPQQEPVFEATMKFPKHPAPQID